MARLYTQGHSNIIQLSISDLSSFFSNRSLARGLVLLVEVAEQLDSESCDIEIGVCRRAVPGVQYGTGTCRDTHATK